MKESPAIFIKSIVLLLWVKSSRNGWLKRRTKPHRLLISSCGSPLQSHEQFSTQKVIIYKEEGEHESMKRIDDMKRFVWQSSPFIPFFFGSWLMNGPLKRFCFSHLPMLDYKKTAAGHKHEAITKGPLRGFIHFFFCHSDRIEVYLVKLSSSIPPLAIKIKISHQNQ